MAQQKSRMLIVEDGESLSDLYVAAFENTFDVTLAKCEKTATPKIAVGNYYDIAIFDIIMPPGPGMNELDVETTGVRLMEACLKNKVCNCFLVISVTGTAQDKLITAINGNGKCTLKKISKFDEEFERLPSIVDEMLANN